MRLTPPWRFRSINFASGADPNAGSGLRNLRNHHANRFIVNPIPFQSAHTRQRVILPGILALLGLLNACGNGEPVLEVGSLAFGESQVAGLPEAQRQRLVRLSAVGLAVGRDEVVRLGGPWLTRARKRALMERLREEMTLEWEGIDEAVLEAQYQTRPEWELEVRHLVRLSERWRPQTEREQARALAAEAMERAQEGHPFHELASEYSEEPGAGSRGGRLQPGREGTWVREFWDAAMALEPGQISPVVEPEFGFHVIQLLERRAVPFPEARDRVAGEVVGLLGGRSRWESWVGERSDEIRIADPEDDPEGPIAFWPGGEWVRADFHEHLQGLPASRVRTLRQPDLSGWEEAVREEATLVRLSRKARNRGIRLGAAQEARLVREWERRVAGWAAVFAFEEGLSDQLLRERILEALTATGQNRSIARDEVDRHAPLLDGAYTVRGSLAP